MFGMNKDEKNTTSKAASQLTRVGSSQVTADGKRKPTIKKPQQRAVHVAAFGVAETEELLRQASQDLEFFASHATGSKKRKRKQSYVKNPSGPFVFFAKEHRAKIRKSSMEQKMSLGEMTREAGRLWRGMSQEEKAPFEELAAKDKERYAREKMAESSMLDGVRRNSSSRDTATAVLGHGESSNAVMLKDQRQSVMNPQRQHGGGDVQPLSLSLQAYQRNLSDQISHLQTQLIQFQARSMFQSRVMQSMQTSSSSCISGGQASHVLGLPVMSCNFNEYNVDMLRSETDPPPPAATVEKQKKNDDGTSNTSHHQGSIFQGKLI